MRTSAIDECMRFVRGEGFGVVADRAAAELAQLRARIEELIEQSESWRRGVVAWQAWADAVIDPANQPEGGKLGDRCAQACIADELRDTREELAWRRERDGSVEFSASKTMARLRREKAEMRDRVEELEGRVERLTAANRDTDRAVAHAHAEWMKATGASSPRDANHLFNLNQELEQNLERALRMCESYMGNHAAVEPAPILTIHRGGPIGGGPQR